MAKIYIHTGRSKTTSQASSGNGGGSYGYDFSVLRYIKIVNGKMLVTIPLGSTGDVFSKGSEDNGGNASSGTLGYDRLDRWADYTVARAGDVLSALLGYDLHTRVRTIETGQVSLTWDNIIGKPSTYAPSAHNHTFSQVTGLQAALDDRALASHNHDTLYTSVSHVGDISHLTAGQREVLNSFSIINGKLVANKPLGSTGDVFAKGVGGDGGSSVFNRLDSWADYTAAKAGYALSALLGYDLHTRLRTIETGQIPLTWDNITGKPATFTPSAHNHTIAQINGLGEALDGKQPIGNYALSSSLNDYLRNDYLSGRVKVNANDILKGVEASYLSSSASNKPGGTDYALLSLSYSGVWSVQMAGDWRTNNWLVRNKNNGTWGSWATLFHSGNSNKSDVDWTSNYVTANSFRTPFAEFRDYNGRMSLATYNFASGYGLNVNNLLVSNQWSDYTKVPALGIYAEGNIKAGGEVSNKSSSDEAFKTDLVTIMKGSDILKKLRPVEFTWNGLMRKYNPDKVGKSASFIAQEFGKVLPWAVSQIYEKYLAIDKEAVIPYLVSGWQEHESELNTLKRRVLSLENEVKQLKNIA